MQVAQAGRPADPRERKQDIFENLPVRGAPSVCWDRRAMFSKIFQKFACLDEDLPKENLP